MHDQSTEILNHLRQYGSIDPITALSEYGCFRLAARINELRKDHHIVTQMIKRQNKLGRTVSFARYELMESKKQSELF